MKNLILSFSLMVIMSTFSFPFSSLSAQINQENPESNEIGYVNLTPLENKEYLDTIKILWERIKKLSPEKKWEYKDLKIMGTNGKDGDGGNKKYIMIIENQSKWDDGNVISQMIFYVMKKVPRSGYFAAETITFLYDHKKERGIGVFFERRSFDDRETHYKSTSQIKERLWKIIHEELNNFL